MENTSSNQSFLKKVWNFLKTKTGIAIIVVLVLIAAFLVFHKTKSSYAFVTVQKGSVTEAVSVTGNTTPIQSVTLGFENGGSIAHVYTSVGQTAYTGEVLAELNTNDLSAQLVQAQANVDTQQAKLDGLKAGAQPEDVASSQANLDKAEQDLSNMYASIADTSNDSYAKGNDAIRTQIGNLFSNADNNSIQLTFITNNSQSATDAKTERIAIGQTLSTWQSELLSISSFSDEATLDKTLSDGLTNLGTVRQLLSNVSEALNGASNLDTTTLATDKASLAAAVTEVNTAVKNLNTIAQNIASQKLIVAQAKAQLDLKQAGATKEDLDAQQAQVEQAQASVESVKAKLANSRIVSPIDGVVTQYDAKVGQIASPGATLVAVMSSNQFEIDALVPETDIGKVAIGNVVDLTFDAFPNETFTGKVFYIDPAQTIISGVVDYKIKVSFDKADQRMKSGLTANLTIETKTDADVLVLPQYAVLQNDAGTFVQKLVNGKATSTPVTLGIQDQNGNVEILSGLSEGEQVLNIGLKQ